MNNVDIMEQDERDMLIKLVGNIKHTEETLKEIKSRLEKGDIKFQKINEAITELKTQRNAVVGVAAIIGAFSLYVVLEFTRWLIKRGS